jgi:hypothetical protein
MSQTDDFPAVLDRANQVFEKSSWYGHIKAKHSFIVYTSTPISLNKFKEFIRSSLGDLYWMLKNVKLSNDMSVYFVATKCFASVGIAAIRLDGAKGPHGCVLKIRPLLNWEYYPQEIKRYTKQLTLVAEQEKLDRIVQAKKRVKRANAIRRVLLEDSSCSDDLSPVKIKLDLSAQFKN